MDNIQGIAEKMYQDWEPQNDYRIYFKSFLPIIKVIDKKQLIIFSLRNFNTQYVTMMLMNLPELWSNTTSQFWIDVLRENSPRLPDLRVSPYDNAKYDDFKFLNRYVGVNPFMAYFKLKDVPLQDKLEVIHYCRQYAPFFVPNEWEDQENYLDNLFYNKEALITFQGKLLSECIFTENVKNQELLTKYLTEIPTSY